jgi:serine/threonine-protein kinase RsbW
MKANLTTICSHKAQEEIRAFITDFLSGVTIADTEKNQIVLSVDEAIANAIIHGHAGDESKSIQIDLNLNDKRLSIDIHDIGLFDIAEEEKVEKEIAEVIKEKQKGGLGLKLIYSIMDIVCFYTKERKSYCRLVKLLNTSEEYQG